MTCLLTNNYEQVVDQLYPSEANGILAHYGNLDAEDIDPDMPETKFFGRNAWLGKTRQSANAYTLREAMRSAWAANPSTFLAHGVTDLDRLARLARGELLTPSNNTARSSARKAFLWTTPASTQTGFLRPGVLWWNSSGLPGLTGRPAGQPNIANANVAAFGAACATAINADQPAGHRAVRIDSWPLFVKSVLSPGGETIYWLRDGEGAGSWPGLWYESWITAVSATWTEWLEAFAGAGGQLNAVLLDAEHQIGRWWMQNKSVYAVSGTPGSVAAGRDFTVSIGGESFAVTAGDSNATTLCNQIAIAWSTLSSGSYPQLSQYTATHVSGSNPPRLNIVHKQQANGYGVPTGLTLSASGGATFAKAVVSISGYRYFPHPNYPAGSTWYGNLKGDSRLTDTYIANTHLPFRAQLNAIETWAPTGNSATVPPADDPTYRINEQTISEFRKAIHQAIYLPLIELFPDCHLFDYDATGKCGGVLPSSDPTSPFGSPVGTNFICGTHQSRNLYSGVNQGGNTRSDCYVPGTGLVQQSRVSELRYTPSGAQAGAVYRAQLIGFPAYAGALTTTNIDFTVVGTTPFAVATGMAAAWNASAVGHVAKITATAVSTGGGNGYVRYTNDDGNQTCEEITFAVVSGTGSGTRTLQVAGAFCRVLDDWWILQGMLGSCSKPLAPYILGPSNATSGNYYCPFGPKWHKAFVVLVQLCSEYVAFWNTGSSATSDALVAEALDEAIEILEGTVGRPLLMPVRNSYDPDTPLEQDIEVNGRIIRFTLDKHGDYTVKVQPLLSPIGNQAIQALSELTFTASATGGPDADLTYSLDLEPDGATIDPETGEFSWTPGDDQDEQTFGFAVVVSDAANGLVNREWIKVQVTAAPNQPPTVEPIAPQSTSEHMLFTYQVVADDDQYDLHYTLSGAPAGMTINSSTGLIAWTPNETHGGGEYTVTVVVRETLNPAPEDFTPLSSQVQFTITCAETNTAPVFAAVPAQQGTEGEPLSFQCVATDADVPAQTLTFTLPSEHNPPAGATISASGLFEWTPSGSQAGLYSVTIRVTDNGAGSLFAERTVSITVAESNRAPVLNPIGPQSITAGDLLTFTATATDPDDDTLVFSLDEPAPPGASITPEGVFTMPTAPGQVASYTATIRVSDDGDPSFDDSETFAISVLASNSAPTLTPIGNRTIAPTQRLTFFLSATDQNAPQQLTYSATGLPTGATLNSLTGEFDWTPTHEQLGQHNVTFTVSDDGSPALDDSEAITIEVVSITPNSMPLTGLSGQLVGAYSSNPQRSGPGSAGPTIGGPQSPGPSPT